MAEKSDTAPAPKPDKTAEAVQRGVDQWVDAHLRNSSFSRDTPAWNHFIEGLPGLVDAIAKEVKG